jgi:hypothetical protein
MRDLLYLFDPNSVAQPLLGSCGDRCRKFGPEDFPTLARESD